VRPEAIANCQLANANFGSRRVREGRWVELMEVTEKLAIGNRQLAMT
jgi:hypothetical protein